MRRKLFWRSLLGAALALAAGAAFAAYLQPSMLVEFANLVLCS